MQFDRSTNAVRYTYGLRIAAMRDYASASANTRARIALERPGDGNDRLVAVEARQEASRLPGA